MAGQHGLDDAFSNPGNQQFYELHAFQPVLAAGPENAEQ
jgi:hypothetical protein